MSGKGIGVVLAQHITTEMIVLMVYAQLSQQGGRQVGLITNLSDASGLFDSTSQPKHGHMVMHRMLLAYLTIAVTVVGQQDNQQVIPCWRLLHLADKVANTLVQIIEGIQNLIVKTVCGHIPRLMTRQRGIAYQERLFLL